MPQVYLRYRPAAPSQEYGSSLAGQLVTLSCNCSQRAVCSYCSWQHCTRRYQREDAQNIWAVNGQVDGSITDVLVLVSQQSCGLILDLFADGLEVCELSVRKVRGKLCVLFPVFCPPQVQQQRPSRADARASRKKVSANLNTRITCTGCTAMLHVDNSVIATLRFRVDFFWCAWGC
jgi:hypothetical protein